VSSVRGRIVDIAAATFGVSPEVLSDASSPDTVENWDSMNHIHLIVALEAEFGVSFEPDRALELINLAEIEKAVHELGGR
jgi:acyl carrier protein